MIFQEAYECKGNHIVISYALFVNFVWHKTVVMNVSSVNPPLSNVQAELLKLFSTDIPDAHLTELKSVIARFLLEKARDKADIIWDEKNYSDEKLRQMLDRK